MKTYNQFKLELSRLRRLYFAAVFSFKQTSSVISTKLRNKGIGGSSELYFEGREDEKYVISKSIFELRGRLKVQLPKYLRELIFIRVISALEVFLIDSIKEIFLLTKEPFKCNSPISMSQGELLSVGSLSEILSKIINKECRNLHSGGFKEISKYYWRTFAIDFNNYPPGNSQLEEYHERRHLIVHQIGKTDKGYRNKYGIKNKRITVEENYLLDCFEDLSSFASCVNESIEQKFTKKTPLEAKENQLLYSIVATINAQIGHDFLDPDFEFWAGDRLIFLKDILIAKDYLDENIVKLKLCSDRDIIKNYVKVLKAYEKKGDIKITERKGNFQTCSLSKEEISKIRALLPEKPWPIGIHRTIAEKLGLKNSEVYIAIGVIISEEKI